MYEYFEFDIDNSRFEWDEEKDHLNFTKHGIHFKTAVKVFLDPNKLIRVDEEHLVRNDITSLEELERCCLWYAH